MKLKATIVFYVLIQIRICFLDSEYINYGTQTQPFLNHARLFYDEDGRQNIEDLSGIFEFFRLIINIVLL